MTKSLSGQVALVTGASRGIGQAIALQLGKKGAFIVGTTTSIEGIEHIEQTLAKYEIPGKGYRLNLTEADSINVFTAALEEYGHMPSILVNNAGITRDNLLMRMKEEEWMSVIDTNLHALYHICKGCIRQMVRAKYGRIINITSIVGLSGNAGQTNYAAAKAGIIGFTRSLAKELGRRSITVNAVAPGFIRTAMTEALTAGHREQIHSQIPLSRLGEAEEVASVVAFLASEEAAYITGETINVSGGLYMG